MTYDEIGPCDVKSPSARSSKCLLDATTLARVQLYRTFGVHISQQIAAFPNSKSLQMLPSKPNLKSLHINPHYALL